MEGNRTLVEGMIAGFLGYAVVAVFFAVLDVAAGLSPFHTPLALGTAIGAGWPGPGEPFGIILAGNGLHLVASLVAALSGAWILREVELYHVLWFAGVLAFAGGLLMLVLAAGLVGAEVTGVTTWARAGGATLLWAAAVGAYLGTSHRDLLRSLDAETRA